VLSNYTDEDKNIWTKEYQSSSQVIYVYWKLIHDQYTKSDDKNGTSDNKNGDSKKYRRIVIVPSSFSSNINRPSTNTEYYPVAYVAPKRNSDSSFSNDNFEIEFVEQQQQGKSMQILIYLGHMKFEVTRHRSKKCVD